MCCNLLQQVATYIDLSDMARAKSHEMIIVSVRITPLVESYAGIVRLFPA